MKQLVVLCVEDNFSSKSFYELDEAQRYMAERFRAKSNIRSASDIKEGFPGHLSRMSAKYYGYSWHIKTKGELFA